MVRLYRHLIYPGYVTKVSHRIGVFRWVSQQGCKALQMRAKNKNAAPFEMRH